MYRPVYLYYLTHDIYTIKNEACVIHVLDKHLMLQYHCARTIGHLTDGESTVTGVPLFLFPFQVSSCEMDGKSERRWLGTSPCDNERTIALRKNALRAYDGRSSELIPPGPRSRVGTIQLSWVSSAYCPNVTYLDFGGRKALCCCCWCGTPAESNG